jgi:hypothetical protein
VSCNLIFCPLHSILCSDNQPHVRPPGKRTELTFFVAILNRFLYDGARIQDDDTPASLDMEDNGAFCVSSSMFAC